MTKQIDNSDRLPFFEVENVSEDGRYGRIKACDENHGPMCVLDYFHDSANEAAHGITGKPGFFVTGLSFSKDIMSSSLERALLYIAACIADDAGEEVIFRRPPYAASSLSQSDKLWEILGVRRLLDNYDALVQQV